MSFVSKLLTVGAALAVAHADYITVTRYSDAGCTVVMRTTYQFNGCQMSGASSSMEPICSSSTFNLYTGTTCSGNPTQMQPLVQGPPPGSVLNLNREPFYGASGSCFFSGGSYWTKWTCSIGVVAVSMLPVGVPVWAFFSDAGCETITGADIYSGCYPNNPEAGMSTSQTCSATQITLNTYSASTTCSGASTQQWTPQTATQGCTAAVSGGGSYQVLCIVAPAKSGDVGASPTQISASSPGYIAAAFCVPMLATAAYVAVLHFRFTTLAKLPMLVTVAGAAWRPLAARSWRLVLSGAALLLFGFIVGLTAVLIPWSVSVTFLTYDMKEGFVTVSVMLQSLTVQVCVSVRGVYCVSLSSDDILKAGWPSGLINGFLSLRASANGIAAVLVLLELPAAVLAAWAAYRLQALAVAGIFAPSGLSRVPSLVAVLGLAWSGFALVCVFTIAAWANTSTMVTSAVEQYAISGTDPSATVTRAPNEGVILIIMAIVFMAAGCALLSFATFYRVGNLPGVGHSRASVFFVEADATRLPPGTNSPAFDASDAAALHLNPVARLDRPTIVIGPKENVTIKREHASNDNKAIAAAAGNNKETGSVEETADASVDMSKAELKELTAACAKRGLSGTGSVAMRAELRAFDDAVAATVQRQPAAALTQAPSRAEPLRVKEADEWVRKSDDSGDVWFESVTTGESSWDLPQGATLVFESAKDAANDVANDDEPLPAHWTRKHDDTDVWYSNSLTGESSWKRPTT
jgi:hypothetical protein